MRVVDDAVIEAHTHLQDRGVAAEVLIWEEEHLLAAAESPLEDRFGVGGGADDAIMLAAESFDVGR